MNVQGIFIAHPENQDQTDALKAVVKAFKIKFEITENRNKEIFLKEMQGSLQQVKKMKEGKLPKQSLKEFLDEL